MHKELTTLTDTELLELMELWQQRWVQAVLCDTGCCGCPKETEEMLTALKAEVKRRLSQRLPVGDKEPFLL